VQSTKLNLYGKKATIRISRRKRKGTQENKAKRGVRQGKKLQYVHRVFHFTFTHHPVPVRSFLNGRFCPDRNICRKGGRSSEVLLGARFQTGLTARQTVERALYYQTRMVRGSKPEHQVKGGETYPVPLHVM